MNTPGHQRWLVALGIVASVFGLAIVALFLFLRSPRVMERSSAKVESAITELVTNPPLFTPDDLLTAQMLKSNPVQKVLSGTRGSVNYTQTLVHGEVIVGHAFRFQRKSAAAVFLMTGPGMFEFSINSGLWYKHTNNVRAVNEALLQGQIDTMVIKYHVPLESLKIHRWDGAPPKEN